jgi:hypothetical protein
MVEKSFLKHGPERGLPFTFAFPWKAWWMSEVYENPD